MDVPANFPVKIQYTEQFLADNPRTKRRAGTAIKMTRGYDGVVTIEWDGSKAKGYVHLDFLEEVK